jgi:hypothetical protein
VADRDKGVRITFAVALGILLLAALGTGIAFLVLSGDPEGRVPDRETDRVITGPDATGYQDAPAGLSVAEYDYDPGTRTIRGSVLNNHTYPYVNVQIEFDTVDATGSQLQPVGDMVGEIGPGEAWTFSIPVAEIEEVASVRLRSVTGTERYGAAPGLEHRPGAEDGDRPLREVR